MTGTVATICTSAVKVVCLAGLFALAWEYDGNMLYVFAASVGGVLGYDFSKLVQMRRK